MRMVQDLPWASSMLRNESKVPAATWPLHNATVDLDVQLVNALLEKASEFTVQYVEANACSMPWCLA